MNRYAIISENIVNNVIIWDGQSQLSIPLSWELIQLENNERCAPSWIYVLDETPRFIEPPIQPIQQTWTAYQFLLQFTPEERAAFRAAALTDSSVADFQQLAQAAQEVISNDPMTIAGMNYLVSVGLLTEARKNEILGV